MIALDSLKSKFTVLVASRIIAGLLLVILALLAWLYVRGLKLDEANARADTEHALASVARGVADDNRRALDGVSDALNKCSLENVRVKNDGKLAMETYVKNEAKLSAAASEWERKYRKARTNPDCDLVLSKSFAACKIKDF